MLEPFKNIMAIGSVEDVLQCVLVGGRLCALSDGKQVEIMVAKCGAEIVSETLAESQCFQG